MEKHRITYNSNLDAVINLTKRLSAYEQRHKMSSEDFYDKYNKGFLDDAVDYIEWANDYQHFLSLKLELEERLNHVA